MKIFVFGWYAQNNLGDEVFKISFHQMFPDFDFTFGHILPRNINEYHSLWIGGGSFLDQPIMNIEKVTIPIYFIGVGLSSSLPECNLKAINRAKMLVCRDSTSFSYVSSRNENSFFASDLVFARDDLSPLNLEKEKQISVILNDFLTPVGDVSDWRSLSYYWFLQEFSKIMDSYAAMGYTIKLLPLCINPRFDDRRIAAAVVGRSNYPQCYDWRLQAISELELRTEISKSAFVVTQRFHGLVYSIIENCYCLTICTHDKFNSLIQDLNIPSLDYYGLTDVKFREVLGKLSQTSFDFNLYVETAKQHWEFIVEKIRQNQVEEV